MKNFLSGLVAILLFLAVSISQPAVSQNSESPPTSFSLRTMIPYDPSRLGYESLPVQIAGAAGGKLGPREKFNIRVTILRNTTSKNIAAVKFSFFMFKSNDLDEVVETRQSELFPLELASFEQRRVDLIVGNVDDIPLLIYKPDSSFHMEIVVSEVHYADGSVWQGFDLPQKRRLPKTP